MPIVKSILVLPPDAVHETNLNQCCLISDGFDIVVNDCFAHNGANKKIQLIDHHGCPVDDKLISKFQGTWGMANTMYETLIYAHMKTFR